MADGHMALLRVLLEHAAFGALSTWTICLAFRLDAVGPTLAALVGAAGMVLGTSVWHSLGWPPGLIVWGFEVVPSLAGTALTAPVAQYVVRYYDEIRKQRQALSDLAPVGPYRRGLMDPLSAPPLPPLPPEPPSDSEPERERADDRPSPAGR